MIRRLFRADSSSPQARFEPLERRSVVTTAGTVAVVDEGSGPPLLFLHGGVVASDYWRDLIRAFRSGFRCLSVDLIGTGDSDRLDDEEGDPYTLDLQLEALEGAVQALRVTEPMTLVVHGWASMVGFRWAATQQHRMRAIAHMESVVGPLAWPNLADAMREHLRMARTSPAAMYSMEYFESAMVLEVVAPLAAPIVEAYRRVWEGGHRDRHAHLSGLRQIPISGQPSEAQSWVLSYQDWLRTSLLPKLLILGEPGMLLGGAQRAQAGRIWNQTVVGVVGSHLLVEESPDDVALFLGAWLRQHVL